MNRLSLLKRCIHALREYIDESGIPSQEAWLAFCDRHSLPHDLKQEADLLVAWLPEACDALATIIEDPLETKENKLMGTIALNYVLMPFDLIPDEEGKDDYYGFVDDALIAGNCMKEILLDCPVDIRMLYEKSQPALDAFQQGLPPAVTKMINQQVVAMQSAMGALAPSKEGDE